MFSAILEKATDVLERRFFMNAFLPSLVFWTLLLLVGAVGLGNTATLFAAWNQQAWIEKTLQTLGFLVWVTLFAGILSSQVTAILRFYEGYWASPPGRHFFTQGQKWHQAYLAKLAASPERYEEIYLNYPLPTQPNAVMPTRLGNILKNAELYAMDRYEIDAVLIWPRLYHLLPERFVLSIGEARSSMDFMLAISMLGGVFALFSSAYLLIVGGTWWLFLLCWWGGLLIAWLAYQSAVGSALFYAQTIKAAFDLYRNDLLKQMQLPLPDSPEHEQAWWRAINAFFYRNVRTLHQNPNLWSKMGKSTEQTEGN